MNARKTIILIAALALTSFGSAFAAVNNVNSRGQFVPMGPNLAARRAYSPPVARRQVSPAPAVASTPAPVVAAAPTEGRRFSYAPAAPTVTATPPCPTATATAPDANGVRRFSYAPGAEATATAAPTVSRTYASRPSASHRSINRWELPKTDPRKYTTD